MYNNIHSRTSKRLTLFFSFFFFFFLNTFIHNEDLPVEYIKVKFIELLKIADLPNPYFVIAKWRKNSNLSDFQIPKNLVIFACKSQNTLGSDDYGRSKICIVFRLDVVDDVNLNNQTGLRQFIFSVFGLRNALASFSVFELRNALALFSVLGLRNAICIA